MTANDWILAYEGFTPEEEPLREALCTLGNGYFATRGAAQEAIAGGPHYPGTYLAGVYNRLETEIAGETVENEDLVNAPNWLLLGFRAGDGDWLDLTRVELLQYRTTLDMRGGLLLRSLRFRDEEGRVTGLESRRFVHMQLPHLAGIETTITAENWSGPATVRSALDGRVTNAGVARYRALNGDHLEIPGQGSGGERPVWLRARTCQSRVEIAQAARTRVYRGDDLVACGRQDASEPGFAAEDLALELKQGEPVSVEKLVALYTSRDIAISEPALDARDAVSRAPRFDELVRTQRRAWDRLWQRANIFINHSDLSRPTRLLRLHAFHMLQVNSANSARLDAGVPARGLHGEAYRGHVFWDELFVFPFYNFRFPCIARSLLEYRYRRLGAARRLARDAGFQGAMFPWQSGSTGREESQRLHLNPESGRWIPDNTHLQRHVNAAVAYNVWQHFEATSDMPFLERAGAEMLLEIARFWASIATWNADRARYEIRGVMGPDEYHDAYPGADVPGIDNNAYTNVMAVWCLSTALECLQLLPPGWRDDIRGKLELDDAEIALWQRISREMLVPFHGDGLISQFEGYESLLEFDWAGYRAKYGDIRRLDRILEAEGDTPNRYKLSKQADVLMLFYLFSAEQLTALMHRLGYDFAPATIPRNIAYYVERTSHGSSLSHVVHSWVLARSDREKSWQLFLEALEADVGDAQHGTTSEGIHLGAMAATTDLVQRCYTGMELREGCLRLHPCLPDGLPALSYTVLYQENELTLDIDKKSVRVSAAHYSRRKVRLFIEDDFLELAPGETVEHVL
ncbi:MAG: glycoside hydrolase family 65 protein, partial [Dichotomicrobium sp.]